MAKYTGRVLHVQLAPFVNRWSIQGLTTPNSDTHIAFVSILLILTYFAFLIIIGIHINIRFPVIRTKVTELYKKMKEKKEDKTTVDDDEPIIQKNTMRIIIL